RSCPSGLIWDSSNYSCAYDSVFCILFNIWMDDRVVRSAQLGPLSSELATLVNGFSDVLSGTISLEQARDVVRCMLHERQRASFPTGP
ncbi:hypothetical protein C8J57DRAFT_982211, partial [Mycena rebaudengoi]